MRISLVRKPIVSACPQCQNTCKHTEDVQKDGRIFWQCQSCGTYSTRAQLADADRRINGR